jgi:hypothetical protein
MDKNQKSDGLKRIRLPRPASLSNSPRTIYDGALVSERPKREVITQVQRTLPRLNTLYTKPQQDIDYSDEGLKRKIISKKIVISMIIIMLSLAALSAGIFFLHTKMTSIPIAIKSQISFPILYPSSNSIMNIKASSIKYNAPNQQLTFVANYGGGTVSFSEQSTPSSFVDVPAVYTSLVSKLNEYDSFDSVNGSVYMLHPKELMGSQSAVMNTKGTLLFARPSFNITVSRWKEIFNNLVILK